MDDVRELLTEELGRQKITLDIRFAENLPPLAIDPIQIQQVLVNILRNAMEAMADVNADRRMLCVEVALKDQKVRIDIADSGPGLSAPDRVFEAFFTTKPRGMGMGLAICRSIVETHGGQLWAENCEPVGARFTFTLPVMSGDQS